ncbi:MAG: FMN-binding protein [Verrucomicrobiales bacterium]
MLKLTRLFAIIVLALSAWFAGADEIEFLNGSKLDGSVIAIHKAEREVEFEAVIGGKSQAIRYPYPKIHRVVWSGKEYIVTPKPAPIATTTAQRPTSRSQTEVEKLIAEVGCTPPDWLAQTPLEFPKSLDLKWPKPPPKGWDNQKNVGQYIWDKINPNSARWKSGVKLMEHLLEVNTADSELRERIMASMGSMYFRFFQDYARAAYWWEQSEGAGEIQDAIGLAECYFRLGNKQMARAKLKSAPLSLAKVKLLGDMGETREALKIIESARMSQPHELYLTAGDICRMDGKFKDAISWYEKVLIAPNARNEEYEERYHNRAQNSIDSIKRFELLDIGKLKDGTYSGSAMGYEGPVNIAATVVSGRVEKVEITDHKEKQYYSALADVPAQIIRKQDLSKVEATSRATITAVAVINATAEALTGTPDE